MDEQKKTLGRSHIYTGDPEGRDLGPIPEGDRRSRRAEPIGYPQKEHLVAPSGRRRRDEETDAKMRLLWVILFVLIAVLVAAIFYEIVLGYGSLETGSQRMNASEQAGIVSETEEDESEGKESEEESQEGSTSEDGHSSVTGSDSTDGQADVTGEDVSGEQENETGADSQTEQETETQIDASAQPETVTGVDSAAQTNEGTTVTGVSTLAGVGE